MKHLSSAEFVDYIEGELAEARASHVASCERCRRQAAELEAALAETRSLDVPEPSPLFWDHVSSRVRAAVGAETPPRRRSVWGWRTAYGLVVVLAIVAIGMVATWRPGQAPGAERPSGDREISQEIPRPDLMDGFGLEPNDDTWELVVALSSDLQWDEAAEAGFGLRAGTADRVLSTLTDVERSELVRILKTELAGTESM